MWLCPNVADFVLVKPPCHEQSGCQMQEHAAESHQPAGTEWVKGDFIG